MKTHLKTFGLILSMLSSVAVFQCASRKSEPVKQKTFVTKNERVARGEQVFMRHCDKCHPAGEGGLGPAINSNPTPQFAKRFQMRHGLGVMPSFTREEISREDLKNISKYLKAWRTY